METDFNNRTLADVLGDVPINLPSDRYGWIDSTYHNDEAPSIVLNASGKETDVQIYFETDSDAESGLVGCTVYFDGSPALNLPLSMATVALAYACGIAELRQDA